MRRGKLWPASTTKENLMKQAMRFGGASSTIALLVAILSPGFDREARGSQPLQAFEPVGFLIRTNYHGWTNSIIVSNGRVEAVIVPAVGRVMQFRFAGEEDGPFWENPGMNGKVPDPEATEWGNFGGDKSWPSPQSEWPKTTSRAWPPPSGFDATPVEVKQDGFVVTLISGVDPHYGIRTYREIKLDLDRPIMTITTTFRKVSGGPLFAGVWVITQLKDPLAAYASLPDFERFRDGYHRQSDELPPHLKNENGYLSLTRDPKASHKIGTDASALIWVGKEAVLRIDSPHKVFGDYPDEGCSAEIYTNPDPLAYVELEMLGPMKKLIVGQRTSRTSTYTLLRRSEADTDLEVRKLFSH